jgi:hypothetical protein
MQKNIKVILILVILVVSGVKNVAIGGRVFMVNDPLYQELLSTEKPIYSGQNNISWTQPLWYYQLRPFAKQYGVKYVWQEAFEELGTNHLNPLLNWGQINRTACDGSPTGWPTLDYESLYDYKVFLYPYPDKDAYCPPRSGAPLIDNRACLLDPRTKQVMIDDIIDGFTRNGTSVYCGVTGADETSERALKDGIKFWAQMGTGYPYLSSINNTIKANYGFGVYGIPTATETNPFAWIAYHRYIADYMIQLQHSIYDTVKSRDANLIVVSSDENTLKNSIDFSGLSPYTDIFTFQIYPDLDSDSSYVGFVTKLFTDISGKPFWPVIHMENYVTSFTPEEIRELMSQVVRNGGSGYTLFPTDQVGIYANGLNYTITEKYGAPTRWKMETELIAKTQDMNKPNYPTNPDCAILYSLDTYYATPFGTTGGRQATSYAYDFLGPYARSWFKFISDNQIANGLVNLSQFKVIYVPYSKYQRSSVQSAIEQYVRNGGTIITGDPRIFNNGIDGTDTSQMRRDLFGVNVIGESNESYVVMHTSIFEPDVSNGQILYTHSSSVNIQIDPNVTTLTTFGSGRPAITQKSYYAGKAIYFAFNPFDSQYISYPDWRSLFLGMQKMLGLETGKDIWRFKFPPFDSNVAPEPFNCLTNNNLVWNLNVPTYPHNVNTGGAYTYSIFPDLTPDVNTTGQILFSKGKLTNRISAPGTITAANDVDTQAWIVSWQSLSPVDITYDLKAAYCVKKVRIYFSKQLPDVTILSSVDGVNWNTIASSSKIDAGSDVMEQAYNVNSNCQYMKIQCGSRDLSKIMELAEIDIWGLSSQQVVGDLNGDCKVDFVDFTLFSSNWLKCNDPVGCN